MPTIVSLSSAMLAVLLSIAAAAPPLVGPLDPLDDSTGDGAGCFFVLAGSEPTTHVLIDRDGLGWMRLDGEVVTLRPEREFVRWPSRTGDELRRLYRSEAATAALEIEVRAGCGELEDDCPVVYGGTLRVTRGADETTLQVEGRCAC